jgi:alkanesulfonate monooxygenase SsuD/methylene tetrahydromethanopterin reductase-like flavin-dependent oxidoreductase (luciferase family)
VLLLNLRHPLLVAKSFATLDYYSHGRMVMAVGTGANVADYPATGVARESRGRRLDEGVEVLRKVWTQTNVSHHGRFFNFDNVTLEPHPERRTNNDSGTIDIWVGGKSEGALKRTARMADGYFASFLTPDEFARNMAAIRGYAAEYGRADARIESGLILLCRLGPSRDRARAELEPVVRSLDRGGDEFFSRTVFGTAEDIIERVNQSIEVGLDKFVLWPVAEPQAWAQQVEIIGREVAGHYARLAKAAA